VTTRTVADIDRELAAQHGRRRDTLDRVVTGMHMLNAIDYRVDVLLDQRIQATEAAT
jgi:hypothetical protein